MRQVRVGTAVAAALNEGEMLMLLGVINALRGEAADRFGQQLRVIGHLDFLDLLPADVQDRFVAFDELPLERSLLAIDVEALDVLAGGMEQVAGDLESKVLVANLAVGGLEGKRRTVLADQILRDAPRPKAGDRVRFALHDRQAR